MSDTPEGYPMNRIESTVDEFRKFLLTGKDPFSKGTTISYCSIIKHVLVTAEPEDLTNPQMLHYMRFGLPASYAANFSSAWKAFRKYCFTEDIELPEIPDSRRIRFAHPIAPDARQILAKFYNGIPADLTWEKFLQMGVEPRLQFAALRVYEFFTGSLTPMANQPIAARSADSLKPMPAWVIDAIAATQGRRTQGLPERFHSDINNQIADAQMSASVSAQIYRMFVAGYDSVRRRSQSSFEENFVAWEQAIQMKDPRGLVLGVQRYFDIDPSQSLAEITFQ